MDFKFRAGRSGRLSRLCMWSACDASGGSVLQSCTVLQGAVLHCIVQAAQQGRVLDAASCDRLPRDQAALHCHAVLVLALYHLPCIHDMLVWLNDPDACLSVWYVCLGRAVLHSCCAETATLAWSPPVPCVDARLVKPPV